MTGNITRTGKHSWRLKFDCPRDPVTGKRVTRRLTVRGSRRDAERELTKMLAQRDSGSLISPSKLLLSEYLEEWLNSWCRANLSPGTAERYQYAVRTQINPHLGHLKLQQLQPAHISAFHAHLLTNGRSQNCGGGALAATTIRSVHRILHKALAVAAEDGLLLKNPVSVKRPPRAEKKPVQILKPEEIPVLMNAIKNRSGLHTFVALALSSGCRRGELLGLRWEDVDFNAGTIRIERSLEETRAGGLRIKAPKTNAGRRTIGIPAPVVDELRSHRKEQLELRLKLGQGRLPDDAAVFTNWRGEMRSPGAISAEFALAAKQAGLGHITMHSLRHCHASMLIRAGVNIVEIARRLGHASCNVTLGTYAHMFSSQDGAAVAAINATLAGAFNQ